MVTPCFFKNKEEETKPRPAFFSLKKLLHFDQPFCFIIKANNPYKYLLKPKTHE